MLLPWFFFLKEDEQLLVESFTSRYVLNGPGRFYVAALRNVQKREAITLGPTEYIHVRDTVSGEVHSEIGPKLYFLQANEEVSKRLVAIPLKANQYVRIIDKRTGVIRVVRGEGSVYLSPTEDVVGQAHNIRLNQNSSATEGSARNRAGKPGATPTPDLNNLATTDFTAAAVQEGINVDELTAVLVRDTTSGRLELITERQVFVPAPNQEIVEIRRLIRLEDHETVVVKDTDGKYLFKRGNNNDRAFFLEPYFELVTFYWSSGIHKDLRNLIITHLDSRPKFMWYEFEARTQDNVELVIGITFFWQIVDVATMIKTTDDTPGDVCAHARSAIIQSVSQVSLEKFLATFNSIVREAVLEADDAFYVERGVRLNAVEVRSISCKDAATQRILQEVIQETTNRLNRIQKQESENETRLKKIQGDTEVEEQRGQLLAIQREHVRTEGLMQGEAEADRVKAFFEGLGSEMSMPDKISIFNTLRKQDVLKNLSEGSAQLYFTPADVDLSIESK
jgi:hypothetical protein